MSKVMDLTITSLDASTAWGLDGSFRFILDELQDAKIAHSVDATDITGKGGRKLSKLKKNKAVTVSGTNGLVSAGLLEAQLGGTFEEKDGTIVAWTDYLTVTSNSATTEYKAVGTTGAEISELYVKNADGTLGDKLEQAATTATGKFAYKPDTKTLTFTDIADGSEVVVFYNRKIAGNVMTNDSDTYSEKLRLYIDATAEDKCSNVYHVQFYIPKADFSGDFDLDMGDNQTVHAFEAESLAGSCGANGALWTYTIFGAEAPDVA